MIILHGIALPRQHPVMKVAEFWPCCHSVRSKGTLMIYKPPPNSQESGTVFELHFQFYWEVAKD